MNSSSDTNDEQYFHRDAGQLQDMDKHYHIINIKDEDKVRKIFQALYWNLFKTNENLLT